ncbi:hemolysin XhlA family protein [Jannaschia sp. S6380]|uniref:hemolysin XhlA family protein n=1 Tax=Jannaschia sp. S6380 TaxID=2926408 RepID=UPI001FF2E1FD|nr:hemolysin XhlA family protein [Jannaschia sp. S6380]MCK0166896.1 hemolysin XhlA family protein [Jannaschia sp. S6380]
MSAAERTGGSRFLYAPFQDTETAFRLTEERLACVETVIARLETDRAVDAEKQIRLETRFNQIDNRLDRIDALISRLVWLIVAAIVGGFVSVALQGNAVGV